MIGAFRFFSVSLIPSSQLTFSDTMLKIMLAIRSQFSALEMLCSLHAVYLLHSSVPTGTSFGFWRRCCFTTASASSSGKTCYVAKARQVPYNPDNSRIFLMNHSYPYHSDSALAVPPIRPPLQRNNRCIGVIWARNSCDLCNHNLNATYCFSKFLHFRLSIELPVQFINFYFSLRFVLTY